MFPSVSECFRAFPWFPSFRPGPAALSLPHTHTYTHSNTHQPTHNTHTHTSPKAPLTLIWPLSLSAYCRLPKFNKRTAKSSLVHISLSTKRANAIHQLTVKHLAHTNRDAYRERREENEEPSSSTGAWITKMHKDTGVMNDLLQPISMLYASSRWWCLCVWLLLCVSVCVCVFVIEFEHLCLVISLYLYVYLCVSQ